MYNVSAVNVIYFTEGCFPMTDKTHELTMLLDFYGELLTQRQRDCFAMHYNEDLSLAEIAELCGISRQAVRDHIVHAEAALRQVEEKTGLLRRFSEQRLVMDSMARELAELKGIVSGEAAVLADSLASQLESIRN